MNNLLNGPHFILSSLLFRDKDIVVDEALETATPDSFQKEQRNQQL